MAASFPTSVKSFTTKSDGQAIDADHINDLQNEMVAVETQLVTSKLASLSDAPVGNKVLASIAGTPTWVDKAPDPVFLATPLTSTAWDGDSFSTTAKTKIDLSVVFGVPDGVKAVLIIMGARDTGSLAGNCYFAVSPNDTASSWAALLKLNGVPDNTQFRQTNIVPCDANGDLYYQCAATGTGTLNLWLEIFGYWL